LHNTIIIVAKRAVPFKLAFLPEVFSGPPGFDTVRIDLWIGPVYTVVIRASNPLEEQGKGL
jgi:hypothetical protein